MQVASRERRSGRGGGPGRGGGRGGPGRAGGRRGARAHAAAARLAGAPVRAHSQQRAHLNTDVEQNLFQIRYKNPLITKGTHELM